MRRSLSRIYLGLRREHGRQLWWPGSTPFEIAVGAVLTQRVAWRNAERAVAALAAEGWLSPQRLRSVPHAMLSERIRPALFHNQKAHRLHDLAALLEDRCGGEIETLLALEGSEQRALLLSVNGIGPETADAIVLYAGGVLSFVVDAYARRILGRYGACAADAPYETLRSWIMDALPRSVPLYQQFHALFVIHGRTICTRRTPRCAACSLRPVCEQLIEKPVAAKRSARSSRASSSRDGTSAP